MPEPLDTAAAEAVTCSCLLLCEEVLVSSARPRHFVQGVISGISAAGPLAPAGPLAIYARVSNVYPGARLQIRFAHGDERSDPLFRFNVAFPDAGGDTDPLMMRTFILRVPPFALPAGGRYILSAWSGETLVNQAAVEVTFTSRGENDDTGPEDAEDE